MQSERHQLKALERKRVCHVGLIRLTHRVDHPADNFAFDGNDAAKLNADTGHFKGVRCDQICYGFSSCLRTFCGSCKHF